MNGVQKVVSSNLTAPTISENPLAFPRKTGVLISYIMV